MVRTLLLLVWLGWATASAAEELSAYERLKSCDTGMAIAAAEQIIQRPESLQEPLDMFAPAAVLFLNGKQDDAVFWFYAAQLRARYQLLFQQDNRPELLAMMLTSVGTPINNYAYQDVDKLNSILDRVFEWDERTPNTWRQSREAAQKQQEIEHLYDGFRALQAKLSERKDEIEEKARNAAPTIQQAYTAKREKLCAPGRPDPVYADQTIRKEWVQVIEYAKADEAVISESGGVRRAVAEGYGTQSDEVLPHRYIVAVEGSARKFSAVIDVIRTQQGGPEFSLICLAETEPAARDPLIDVCQQ